MSGLEPPISALGQFRRLRMRLAESDIDSLVSAGRVAGQGSTAPGAGPGKG